MGLPCYRLRVSLQRALGHYFPYTSDFGEISYEVRDLFPWKMPTKMITSCLLNVKKNLKLGANKLKLDLKLLPKICFWSNNIHREIDQWNRRRFGAKWNVTVPNSVTPVNPIAYANEYTCYRLMLSNDTQNTPILNFHPYFRETVILSNFYKNQWRKMQFFVV